MTEILTATQSAKLIRADIKAAAKANTLGDYPAGTKFSVRTGHASLMSEIAVTIKGAPTDWALITVSDEYGDRQVPSPAARVLAEKLMTLVRRHYQADGRHRFADVRVQNGEFTSTVLWR